LGLLHELVGLQGGDEPERGALVDAQLHRDLRDAGLPESRQDPEDGQRPVDGLDTAVGLPAVAHRATVAPHALRIARCARPRRNTWEPSAVTYVLTIICPDRPGIVHAV